MAFLDAVLPDECVVCGRSLVSGEKFICLHCDYDMPRIELKSLTENEIHYTLATTRPVDRAAGLFYYRRGSSFTRLIQQAKYNDRPQLARWLGEQLGSAYVYSGLFDEIDALVPVPINWFKELRRSYNQSLKIAEGISRITGIPVFDCLKARHHSTQTRKTARRRFENTMGVYSVRRGSWSHLQGLKHVMLIDDVITTGSTVLQCVEALRSANPFINVSVSAPAITKI